MRSVALTLLAALVSASVGHGDVGEPPCLVPLGPPEGIGRWSDEAPILSDPEQGPVVSVPLAAGTSFRSLELPVEFGPFEEEDALQFWWRSEGEGLRSFYIKVRSAPLAGGMEAVYVVWEPQLGPPPTEWTFVRLPLRRPRWDDWGERPVLDRRYLTLRVSGDQQARGAVLLADLELFRPCVTLRPDPVPPGDYAETIGGTVHNRTDRPLAVELGTGDRLLQTIALLPNETRRWEAPNPVDRSTWEKARPLHRWSVPVWIRLTGHPQTQTSQEIVQMKGLQLAEHPRLLLNSEGIARLNERLETTPEGQRYREQLLRRAEERLEEPVILPPRGGNWWHYYTSPETGAALRTGRKIGEWQWEHIDPVTGKTYRGDPSNPATDYDGVVIAGVHNGWARAIRDLGLAYHVTGNAAYADKAREILLAYAEAYLSYPLHTIRGEPRIGGGRVGPQTLDEATWLIPVAQGADLIWSRLSESERNRLAERLFQPAVREVILPHKQGVHNIQCWKNSAIGLVGFLLGDLELIGEAIENPERGYRRQMEGGVSPDGVWWEGAWGVPFLHALGSLAAHRSGPKQRPEPLR
ncbi:MAG: hypothetical protein KatS3mg115_1794 [Candidatus Poribacteria bacterium]|nr:MAG: hypothetical protein KatS3mg115_1794 [Candidatus Poribacteria bacterium]